MKKHLIAAAVAAAVAVPAAAQVTISGVLDLSPHSDRKTTVGSDSIRTKGTGNDSARGQATGNRINFSFSEDLGGGLKADGLYRIRYDSAAGQAANAADDMFVRVSGGFGSLRVGRYTGFIGNVEAATGAFTPTNSAGGIGVGGANFIGGSMSTNAATITDATGAVTKAAPATGALDDTQGLIQYVSPNFSGLTVTLDYSNRSADEASTAGMAEARQQGLGISYTAGPLQVQAATGKKEVTGVVGTSEAAAATEADVRWAAANYDLKVAKVFVGTAQRKDKTTAGATSDDVRLNFVGVQVPMGAATLFASFYDGEDKNTGVTGAAATEKRTLSGNQVAVRYSLSKRTYAYLLSGRNEDKGATAGTNFKQSDTAIGIVHSF